MAQINLRHFFYPQNQTVAVLSAGYHYRQTVYTRFGKHPDHIRSGRKIFYG